jgi:hypothetical protein
MLVESKINPTGQKPEAEHDGIRSFDQANNVQDDCDEQQRQWDVPVRDLCDWRSYNHL